MDADVIVVGAGLAGLNAARVLEEGGLTPLVLEAATSVGGRVRTELIDGYRVDRGFQLINPAYPALRQAVDVGRLAVRAFGRGVAVRTSTALREITDPTRAPRRALDMLHLLVTDRREAAAIAAWLAPAAAGRRALQMLPDTTLSESLDAAGVRGALRDDVLEPFLAGVLADDTGTTSATFVRWLLRWFSLATPGLPGQGMAALPELLRASVSGEIRLGARVTEVSHHAGEWTARTDAGPVTARGIVLAAGPAASAALMGAPAPAMRGLTTWWFTPDAAPTASTMIHLDGERRGPVVNTAVVSNVQPSYAPAGGHLVEASTLLRGEAPSEAQVREHVGRIYGTDAGTWPLLRVHEIPQALPAIAPGHCFRAQPTRGSLVVAGDVADASIQGALDSGRSAALHLVTALAGSPRTTAES